jgi:cephalosporin hydroxylase
MQLYGPLVSKGCYMIVEDGNIHGHPVRPDLGPGPLEATVEFMKTSKDFQIDLAREKYYLTQNPQGYLLKLN